MTHYDTCLISIPGRDICRPAPSREREIRKLEQYLFEMSPFSWTVAYQQAQARLAELKQEA